MMRSKLRLGRTHGPGAPAPADLMATRWRHRPMVPAAANEPGADPKVVLGTMLWRTEDIIRLRGHGYWLKNRSFEPAGYNPKKPPFEDTMSEHAKGEFEDILT
jgi:hypothetical protein